MAAHAVLEGETLRLTGFYVNAAGAWFKDSAAGAVGTAEALGAELAERMRRGTPMKGFVTLVGAGSRGSGPADHQGKAALEQAEVVVYDRLVSPAILAMMPETAEKINVGKEASRHPVPQGEINRILLEKALEGKRVVRLKGGDPFVFGRGGEELELLAEHGVPFEEVPGITSAIAAAAYAGIPVTHRDFCSSLHIVTGHARAGKELSIDFEALEATKGTLVFLMGCAPCPASSGAFWPRAWTRRPRRPWWSGVPRPGSAAAPPPWPRCRSGRRPWVSGAPPSSWWGPVCALAEKFDWFSRLPLKGRAVVVTRPRDRAGTLSARLRALGADVLEYPCIETKPLVPCPAMTAALEDLSGYAWLVFTSPAGVAAFRDALRRMGKDARHLAGVKLAAIGPGTARALRDMGLMADFVPETYDAAHLAVGLRGEGKALLLRAEWGTPALTEGLKARNIPYEDIAVYETRYETRTPPRCGSVWRRGEAPGELHQRLHREGFVSSLGEGAT